MDISANSRQLAMVAVDHAFLAEAVTNLRQYMLDGRPENWRPQIEAFLAQASERLSRHFRYEEQIVFPVVLEKDESEVTVATIAGLKEGHRELLEDLEVLNVLFKSPQLDRDSADFWKHLQEFIDDLQEHTVREDYFFGKGYPKDAPPIVV